jgi:hypothetical protein
VNCHDAVPLVAAFVLIVNVVALMMEVTVVPARMPVPETLMPTNKLAVEATVTVFEPLTRVALRLNGTAAQFEELYTAIAILVALTKFV